MKDIFGKYLGDDIPVRERIFYLATFMSGLACLLFVSVAFLFRVEPVSVAIYTSIGIMATLLFFLESKFHKLKLFSFIFLEYTNLLAFPAIMILSENDIIEAPLYSMIGLVFALVLLEKNHRTIQYIVQIFVDISVAYYCFVYRNPDIIHHGASTNSDFYRIEAATIVTGLLCGIIVEYRHYQLKKEMDTRETANEKAEKVSFAKDMFLVNVSHEIRTPLNAIIGTTQLLLDSDASNHVKETAFNISNSSQALLSITTDLLDFSCMNMNEMSAVEENYDISFVLNDIINLMSVRLLDSNVVFYVHINPQLPKLLIGDCGKIRQIIINMLSNAIKYTKNGHIDFSVDYEDRGNGLISLKVKVEDTGIGIRAESIDKIFEPYNRSGEITDRLIEGNGLGLALCKKLASCMNGKIWAESVYGEGSVFYLEVPQFINLDSKEGNVGYLNNPDASIAFYMSNSRESDELYACLNRMKIKASLVSSDEEFTEQCIMNKCNYYLLDSCTYEHIKDKLFEFDINWSKIVVVSDCNYSYSGEPFEFVLTKPISCLNISDLINLSKNFAVRKQKFEGDFSAPNATVLVVDDNLLNLDVAVGLLERYKVKVITAASGKECISTLLNDHVDLVLLDYMMPEMDGIDTLKEIRKINGGKFIDLPVVTLTANVVSGAKEMFIGAGFDAYLSKPLEIDKLERTLLEFLPDSLIKHNLKRH